MARRNIGGEDADYAAFLASRQQPQTDPRMAMAMQIMGLMEKQQTAQQDQALEERKQQAQEMYQSGQLANLAEQRRIDELKAQSEAEARTAATTGRIQEGMTAADREATRKEEKATELKAAEALNKQKLAGETLKEMLPYYAKDQVTGRIVDPEYAALKERATPGLNEELEQAKTNLRTRQVQEGLAKYLSATPKERETYAKGPGSVALGPPDVVSEILKQAGVRVPASEVAAPPSGLSGGIQDVLWNLPGGVENIFRGVSNLGAKAWYGGNAPQYSYVPWTSASKEIPKYLGEGPPVAPPPAGPMPRPQYGNYGVQAEPAGAPPEWQYGVGQQRPPPQPLNDLLAKVLQNQYQ